MPAIREGDRLLVIDRKLFKDDNTRIFIGAVEECDDGVIRARGYAYHISPYELSGNERHGEERVRLVSLTGGDMIYMLPREVDIKQLQLRRSPKALMLTDTKDLTMDLTEWLLRG